MKHSSYVDKANKNLIAEDSQIIKSYDAILKQNEYVEKLRRQYFDASATEEEQHESYKEYCQDLHNMFLEESIPSFDAWKNRPLRLYGIQQSLINDAEHECQEYNSYDKEPVTQSSIDHVVIECILKIIEKQCNIFVDIDSIKQCLENTKNIELLNSFPLQADIIPFSNKSIAEQHKKILQNNELMESIRKLEELDFIKPKK